MIRQVRLREVYLDATGSLNERMDPVFAFGTHPQAPPEAVHEVTSAQAVGSSPNKLRVIMDELLVGNYLEEIKCRAQIDEDNYDSVPIGTTPDDIARCAVAKDVLPASCKGTDDHATCICKNDLGCNGAAKGEAVGVEDVNQDGASDDTRLIKGAVGLRCGTIDVPIDSDLSYWNPSGDQNVPAMGGFDALGPALVLVPGAPPNPPVPNTIAPLPTNVTCGLVFSPSVVDKQNIGVCAPPDGDVSKDCNPGDVSNFSFKVQPLVVKQSTPAEGDTGASRTQSMDITFTAPLSAAAVSAITVKEGATNYTQFTATLPLPTTVRLVWTATGGLAANTMYTVSVSTAAVDLYNQAMPMPATITFTTGS